MTNNEIESRLRTLVSEERRLAREIIALIREADRRKLWADRGFASPHEWLTKSLGYSEGAAHRRIAAAKLIEQLPELAAKLESGEANLSTLSLLHTTFRKQERCTGTKVSLETKREIVKQCEGKSRAEAERTLAAVFPEARTHDSLRPTSATTYRLSTEIDEDGRADLERSRELLSHAIPGATWGEIVARLAAEFVKRNDPLQKPARPAEHAPAKRNPAAGLRRQVIQKARAQCEYVDAQTQRRCESRHQIEIDHVQPYAMGGPTTHENLRALCRAHNQRQGEKAFGHSRATGHIARNPDGPRC